MFGKLKAMFGPKGPGKKAPPKRVNLQRRFRVVGEVSTQGSMSKVYRALDNETGRAVCLKVQLADKNAAAAARSSRVERKPDEGEIASQIVHPNVVRTLEWGVSPKGEHFLVMEFIEGESLQFIRQTHGADLPRKVELLAQAAEGLAAVHQCGFIHHDIGPKNYLVDREGRVKLIDFGLAVPNTEAFRRPGNRTGTLKYMAPELIRRDTTDERIDIFSFGAMAFELFTGRLPYDTAGANSMSLLLQRMNTDPMDPLRADPTLPTDLVEILRKLIARRKEDRWPSTANLAEALRGARIELRSERHGIQPGRHAAP